MRRKWLTGLALVTLVGCGLASHNSTDEAPSSNPKLDPATAARVKAVQALVEGHRMSDWTSQRIVGDENSPDLRVQMAMRAKRVVPKTTPSVDWKITTSAPVHSSPAALGAWTSEQTTDMLAFAVDGTGTCGLTSAGLVNNPVSGAGVTTSAIYLLTDLYSATGKPALSAVGLTGSGEQFGRSGLVWNVSGTTLYALSAQGKLHAFTVTAANKGVQAGNAATLTEAAAAFSAASTVTWSSPYPAYNFGTGAVTSLYFGDDAGNFYCVDGTSLAACTGWTSAGVQLAAASTAPLGPPVVNQDSTLPGNVAFVGDGRGRFFRVEDKGTTPSSGAGTISQQDLCGAGSNNCGPGSPTQIYGVFDAPALDYATSPNKVYVVANTGTNGANTGTATMFEFPLLSTANFAPDTTNKTLLANVTGSIEGAVALDNANDYAYVPLHNRLYKVKYPFDGNASSNVTSVGLQEVATVAPSDGFTSTQSFPRGYPLHFYSSMFVGTGTDTGAAVTGEVERYGCTTGTPAPTLLGTTTSAGGGAAGNLVETALLLDSSNGNLNYGFATSTNTGGVIQMPAANDASSIAAQAGWPCPGTETAQAGPSQCGGGNTSCQAVVGGCSGGPGAQGTCAAAANAVVYCSAGAGGVCQINSCSAGFANCDGLEPNGCEVGTNTDVNNCGGCGNTCTLSNNSPTCASGTCEFECNAGAFNCSVASGNTASSGCPNTGSAAGSAGCGLQSAGVANCCGSATSCGAGQVCTNPPTSNTGEAACTALAANIPVSCGTSTDPTSTVLQCPAGQKITTITHAFFGNPTGACKAYAAGSCNAGAQATGGGVLSTINYVKGLCAGLQTCTVPAVFTSGSTAGFTNPGPACTGISPYQLDIEYQCTCGGCVTALDCGGATPICNTNNDTHGYSCVACQNDGNCSGTPATPACDTTPSDANAYKCEQCTASNHSLCTGATPVCDLTTNLCVACNSDSDCAGVVGKNVCVNNACVQCDSAEPGACSGGTPYCATLDFVGDPDANSCVQCNADHPDCTGATNAFSNPAPVCDATKNDPTLHECVQCDSVDNTQCNGTVVPQCQTVGTAEASFDTCVQCTANAQCVTDISNGTVPSGQTTCEKTSGATLEYNCVCKNGGVSGGQNNNKVGSCTGTERCVNYGTEPAGFGSCVTFPCVATGSCTPTSGGTTGNCCPSGTTCQTSGAGNGLCQ